MNETILVEVVFLQSFVEIKKTVRASGRKLRIRNEYKIGDIAVYVSEDPMLQWLIDNKMAVENRRASKLTDLGFDEGSPVRRPILPEPVVQEIKKPKKKVVKKVSTKRKQSK